MPDLKKLLQRSSSGPARPLDVNELWDTSRKRARRSRALGALGVTFLLGGSALAAANLDLIGGSATKQRSSSTERSIRPAPDKEPSSATCLPESVLCISVDRPWSIVHAAFGSAWAGNLGEGKTFGIARIDAETGKETARIPTEGFVKSFASDDRRMWALIEAKERVRLLMIDPDRAEVAEEFELGPESSIGDPSIVAGAGYVWISEPNGNVARVSSSDGESSTYSYGDSLPGYGRDRGPLRLAYGEGRVWLSYGVGHIGVVEPRSGKLVRVDEKALGTNAYNIVVADGYLWSPHQAPDGTNVLSYAPVDGGLEARGQVLLAEAVPGLAATDGSTIWVVQEAFDQKDPDLLVEVDARARAMVGEPLELDIEFQGTVASDAGYVWVTGNQLLYRISS